MNSDLYKVAGIMLIAMAIDTVNNYLALGVILLILGFYRDVKEKELQELKQIILNDKSSKKE